MSIVRPDSLAGEVQLTLLGVQQTQGDPETKLTCMSFGPLDGMKKAAATDVVW